MRVGLTWLLTARMVASSVLFGTPIINLPQAAVLGMRTTKYKPVVVNGQIVVRPIMVVALTYDHRLMDGRKVVTVLG